MKDRRKGHVTVENSVISILAKEFGAPSGSITPATTLVADLGVDSFKALELLYILKDTFEIDMTPDDIKKTKTVGDVINYVLAAKKG
jgi:acyl carrier protein